MKVKIAFSCFHFFCTLFLTRHKVIKLRSYKSLFFILAQGNRLKTPTFTLFAENPVSLRKEKKKIVLSYSMCLTLHAHFLDLRLENFSELNHKVSNLEYKMKVTRKTF